METNKTYGAASGDGTISSGGMTRESAMRRAQEIADQTRDAAEVYAEPANEGDAPVATVEPATVTAEIEVSANGSPSEHYPAAEQVANGATDYDVTVTLWRGGIVQDVIDGGITLYRDDANGGRMSTCGSPLDVWCSSEIVTWLRTLDRSSYRAAVGSLAGGPGAETIEVKS